jgi:asparagine N-glycosylation enzyme membrane subunit Stt3
MAKKDWKEVLDVAKKVVLDKRFQIGLTIVLFLVILISSTSIRLSNLPILKDTTTGLYTSNDLDSLYFYREAETLMNNGGSLPTTDILRAPAQGHGWIKEILPNVLVGLFKIEKLFSPSITFDYSATISAPIIFAGLLILFFLLCWALTRSKLASLIGSAFLAFSPAFLFRSVAGFYDHDHLGVLAIILSLLVLFYGLKNIDGKLRDTMISSVLFGLSACLILFSWGGGITFIFVAAPLASLLFYLFGTDKKERFMLFYLIWIITFVFSALIFGHGSLHSIIGMLVGSTGFAVSFVLLFFICDWLITKYKDNMKFIKEKYLRVYSLVAPVVIGLIGLAVIGKNPLDLIRSVWGTLIYPFFGNFVGRLGTTVAENAQPYLTDLTAQITKPVFYLFVFGLFFMGLHLIREIKQIKYKVIGILTWTALCFGILFSRTSSSIYLLNGESLVSQVIYLLGVISFFVFLFFIENKEKPKFDVRIILLIAISIAVMINARAAVRSFFLITPFICLLAGYSVYEVIIYLTRAKDETLKYALWAGVIIACLVTLYALFGTFSTTHPGTYQISAEQAKYIGPSTNDEWQNAMAWIRNNTDTGDIFVHWWDYGYFIQTLAGRPTVTDGGHAAGDNADHNIGRYILTTPNPATAYSYMKTWNVSYLLIDPTDMSKYGAFSKIGSNDSWDRISTGVASGASDDKNVQETANGVTRIYNVQTCVDSDIDYRENGSKIFLPGISVGKTQSLSCNSYLGGIILEMSGEGNSLQVGQPIGVYVYQNKQYRVPIKNLYFNGKMSSFPSGLDAVAYIIPKVSSTTDGKISLDPIGAMIYLSPRVFDSLLGKVYVLNDYAKEYTGLRLSDSEDGQAVKYFKQTWGITNDFVYFNGLQAPLKIWKVDYPLGTPVHNEFLANGITEGYGGMDKYF